MAYSREGYRLAGTVLRKQLPLRAAPHCAGRFASTQAEKPSSNNVKDLSELDSASSFLTPPPDESTAKNFSIDKQNIRDRKLPGNRYQYHPPKYDRGPLHPVQSPPSSDPIARNFVPGPFNHPRVKHTIESTIASDLLTLTYQHTPPGEVRSTTTKGNLREWDGSSPYHKNRPRRAPRGPGSDRLPLLERDITFNTYPGIKSVSISAHEPKVHADKEHRHVVRAILQAISGQFPKLNIIRSHNSQFKIKEGEIGGAKVTLTGDAAFEFFDKLVTLVLPKIKEWPGVKANSGDRNGNFNFGLTPDSMAYFPELEYNYSSYPTRMIPGCHISVQTTATSDRQGRLILEALGMPFYGKVRN